MGAGGSRHSSLRGPEPWENGGPLRARRRAVLALFAIITAVYAVRAFRKQSQEVSDQATMLKVQSEQLAEQRRINEEAD